MTAVGVVGSEVVLGRSLRVLRRGVRRPWDRRGWRSRFLVVRRSCRVGLRGGRCRLRAPILLLLGVFDRSWWLRSGSCFGRPLCSGSGGCLWRCRTGETTRSCRTRQLLLRHSTGSSTQDSRLVDPGVHVSCTDVSLRSLQSSISIAVVLLQSHPLNHPKTPPTNRFVAGSCPAVACPCLY